MLESVREHLDHSKSRRIFSEWTTYRAAGDHFDRSRAAVRIAMVVTGEDSSHPRLFHSGQRYLATSDWQIEVLFGLVIGFQEPGMVLEYQDVLSAGPVGSQ